MSFLLKALESCNLHIFHQYLHLLSVRSNKTTTTAKLHNSLRAFSFASPVFASAIKIPNIGIGSFGVCQKARKNEMAILKFIAPTLTDIARRR